MNKTQLKALATKIHGLAVKSANGKKPAQNKALEKIATLLNQTIEAEIKQAYTGIASQVRGLAEKLEPRSARRAVGRKKVSRRKPVVANKKSERRRGRVSPTKSGNQDKAGAKRLFAPHRCLLLSAQRGMESMPWFWRLMPSANVSPSALNRSRRISSQRIWPSTSGLKQ
jgi:hypothetical protein